jgi:hypothetical protein
MCFILFTPSNTVRLHNFFLYVNLYSVFPLICAGARPRSNWNASAHAELLPRSWNVSIFIVNIIIMHITKNFQRVAQSSGRVKFFCSEQQQGRVAVKQKLEGTLVVL